jgi:hypothetical protein
MKPKWWLLAGLGCFAASILVLGAALQLDPTHGVLSMVVAGLAALLAVGSIVACIIFYSRLAEKPADDPLHKGRPRD